MERRVSCNLSEVVLRSFFKMMLVRVSRGGIWGEMFLGRGSSRCKCFEVGERLEYIIFIIFVIFIIIFFFMYDF